MTLFTVVLKGLVMPLNVKWERFDFVQNFMASKFIDELTNSD